MDIRNEIKARHSKVSAEKIKVAIMKDPTKMRDLMEVIKGGSSVMKQRASWPLSLVAEQLPDILYPYIPELTAILATHGNHPAVDRNIVRAFQYTDIPEELEGEVADKCFSLLNDNGMPVAIRVFSMQVLYNLTSRYPELGRELDASIKAHWDHSSAGFRSRGRKILKGLSKASD
jgi:hypothetical protein